MFLRVWRRAEMFERMAGLLGVHLPKAARLDQGEAIRLARDNCLHCGKAQDCRNWMDASDGLPLPPDYCPNARFFERCHKPDAAIAQCTRQSDEK